MPGAPGLASETWESKEARAAEFDYTAWCVSMALYSARRPGQAGSGSTVPLSIGNHRLCELL